LTDPGAVAALSLLVTAGPAAGQSILVEDRLVIGRHSDGPGRLAEDPELSRHHAQISRQPDGGFTIEDLASTNGTIVNGTRIPGPAILKTSDSIEVGGTTMVVADAPSPPAAAPGVDVRAATVTVNVPPPMRGVGPATEEIPPAAPPPPLTPPPPPPPEPPTPVPSPPVPLPLDEVSRDQSVPYLPRAVPPANPPVLEHQDEVPTRAAGPALPRLSLQLVIDAELGQVEIRLDDAGEPIRLMLVDGRWQVTDGGE
jgi:predicted component of type VI protein secretion system